MDYVYILQSLKAKDKFYIGHYTWQGVEYVNGKHPLFIPEELFWAVQETFGLKTPLTRHSAVIFGGGWLRCGTCGTHWPGWGWALCWARDSRLFWAE